MNLGHPQIKGGGHRRNDGAIVAAGSPHLLDIAQRMPGREAANHKLIQCLLRLADLRMALLRLFRTDARKPKP